MKKTLTAALPLSLLTLSILTAAGPAAATEELFIYNWSDYTAPEVLAKFEKETGIKVTLDVYDSNETLLAKMKAGNAAYDIVVPSHNFVPIMIKDGLLQPIDAPKLSNYANIDEKWRNPEWDPGNRYTVPWMWGTTSFAVDTAVYKGPTDSASLLFTPPPELRGNIGMFKTPEEVVAVASIALGLPQCDDNPKDLKKVEELLAGQKPAVKIYSSEGIHERLAAGEVAMHMIWNGAAKRARDVRPTITYVYPKEGVLAFMDNLTVPKTAKNVKNALTFIDFMLKPENIAIQSNFARYSNGIKGSQTFLSPDLRDAPEINPPATVKTVFQPVCSDQAVKLRDRVWTRLFQ